MIKRRPHHLMLNASRGAFVALGLLAGVEGLLAVSGVPDPGLYAGDPAILWWLRSDLDRVVPFPEENAEFHVRTTALGFRGNDPPDSGAWTLALGCSTTFGWGVSVDEAWPALLTDRLGEVFVNGGVPGWSTEQAIRGVERWRDLEPARVILAYGVRDSDPAPVPDSRRSATPWLLSTHLARAVTTLMPRREAPGYHDVRVPPERFAANLRVLLEHYEQADVFFLAFPQPKVNVEKMAAWWDVLGQLSAELNRPLIRAELPDEAFFSRDPVHLTAEGHQALARLMESSLSAVSTGQPAAP